MVCWECVLAQPLKNSTVEIETKLWISKNLIKVFWSFRVCAHGDYIRWRIWSSISTTPVISGKCMAAGSNDNTRRGQLAARACASPSSASILSPLAQQDHPALSDLIAMVAELTVARSDLPRPIASRHTSSRQWASPIKLVCMLVNFVLMTACTLSLNENQKKRDTLDQVSRLVIQFPRPVWEERTRISFTVSLPKWCRSRQRRSCR